MLVTAILGCTPTSGQTEHLKKLYGDYVAGGAAEVCANHKAIAVMPADVSILYRKIEPDFKLSDALNYERQVANAWAKSFYEAMMKTMPDSNLRLIHPDTVAARFALAGIVPDSMHYYERSYLARVAGADALVLNDLIMSKQHTEFGTAMINISGIFATILSAASPSPTIVGWGASGTEVDYSLSIYDGPTGMLLWMARTKSSSEENKLFWKGGKDKRRFPYVMP